MSKNEEEKPLACYLCGKGITLEEAHAIPYPDGPDDSIHQPICNECYINRAQKRNL